MRRDRTMLIVSVLLVLAVAMAGPAFGAKKTKFKAKPFTFDPGATGIVSAKWVTHQGLGDAGKSDHALVLQKQGTTATVASAGAAISKVKNLVLTELGFDVEDGTHCGAGAPRYNVTLTDGSVFFFGCAHGDMTPVGADSQGDTWTRVRFTDADAFYGGGPTAVWPGFGVAVAQAIHVVFDEGTDTPLTTGTPGLVRMDNLDVNGKLMGKPGNSKN
jgi:hypothetical protein